MYRRLLDMHIAVRVLGIILEVAFYGLSVVAFVYALLYCQDAAVMALVIIAMIICLTSFILSIISKTASSFPVSIMTFIMALVMCFMSNFNGGIIVASHLSDKINVKYAFNEDCYYAFASIAQIVSFAMLLTFNVMSISLKPLFGGITTEAETGTMISQNEDDDLRSTETSYHYWAHHLVAIGAVCLLSCFTCPPPNNASAYVNWFGTGFGCILGGLIVLWTIFFPMVAKDRDFS